MSNIIPECYENIVGLSRTNCECYEMPETASISQSGLYIDELESLQSLQAITDCESGTDVFDQMIKAREIAIMSFQADTNALLLKTHTLKRLPFNGAIGRAVINKATVTQTNANWYGVRLWCENIKGGTIMLKNIGALFTDTGTIDLQVWNNLGELVDTITLNTTANKHEINSVNLELPLHSKYVDNLEYYLVYQYTGNLCKNNDIKCNCGGFKPQFNTVKPYTMHRNMDRNFMWSNWIMVGGYSTATLPNFGEVQLSTTTNNNMYGLTLDVDIRCNVSEVLCYEQLDFLNNPLAGATALAIQHKSALVLGGWILNSNNLNRVTFANKEQLAADMAKWQQTYNDMIMYISKEVDTSVNDCLICKDIFTMIKGGILA